MVVVATAKVQIFKQITTHAYWCLEFRKLLLLPQRYKFSSKSQHLTKTLSLDLSCCCYRKGTNFQANHNRQYGDIKQQVVVVATAKVQIFKQITTCNPLSRTNGGCCCYRKGTNFQANHNRVGKYDADTRVVVATAKVQIFKQITTRIRSLGSQCGLLLLPQRYKFSSKSQPSSSAKKSFSVVVATAKVQIFKQITTGRPL